MSGPDLDLLAVEIAGKTGSPVTQVREGLDKFDSAGLASVCKALGLNFTPNGRKRGRPQHPALIQLRQLWPEKSPRTVARYARALRMLAEAGVSEQVTRNLVETYTRDGGSFNVSGFERHAEFLFLTGQHGEAAP